MGKGEIARNEQFLLFPQYFQLNQIIVYPSVYFFDIISLLAVELEKLKIDISGKGLTPRPTIQLAQTGTAINSLPHKPEF